MLVRLKMPVAGDGLDRRLRACATRAPVRVGFLGTTEVASRMARLLAVDSMERRFAWQLKMRQVISKRVLKGRA